MSVERIHSYSCKALVIMQRFQFTAGHLYTSTAQLPLLSACAVCAADKLPGALHSLVWLRANCEAGGSMEYRVLKKKI